MVELNRQQEPVAIASAALRGPALETQGPMLLSGEWWDARAWQRAEWDLQLADGTLCRICQEGDAWFLEGIYD